jgi:hypothetical protein
MSLTEAVRA